MRIKFLLTPSIRINGLPEPTPKAGETHDIAESVAMPLIRQAIAIPVEPKRGRPKKIEARPEPPAIAQTEESEKPKETE